MEMGAVRRAASYATGTHAVLPVFEAFQSARVEFAQEIAKLALPNARCAANTGTPGGTYEVDGPAKHGTPCYAMCRGAEAAPARVTER